MTTQLLMIRDISGAVTYGLPFCDFDHNYDGKLAANTAESITVPSDAAKFLAVFSFEIGTTVYVANNQTATVPSGSPAKSYNQGNPAARLVNAGDVISMITADTTAKYTVSLYAI